jgi:hypothetical protein
MKKKKLKNFINPIEMSELKKIPKDIEILQEGDWNHPSYGLIKITKEDLSDFVKNFDAKIRNDLPINVEHNNTDGAVGWFRKLIVRGNSLWAKVEWTVKGRQLLKEKIFKYFSPEFYSTYEDPESRKIYKNVLVGGAITNTPYFKGLKAIVFSESAIKDMDKLEKILAKEIKDLTDEDKKELKTNKEKLTDEQREKFKQVFEEEAEEKKEEITEEEIKEEKKEEGVQGGGSEEKKEASEGVIQMSEAKLKILERNAEEGVKAMAELRRQKANSFVESMTFSEKNQIGLILPKSKDKVVNFLLSLSSDQAEEFKEILGELPKPKSGMFNEIGKEEAGIEGNAANKVNKLVEAKMKDNDKLTYREALDVVLAENAGLAEELA